MSTDFYKVDGVLWRGKTHPEPYCPKHRLQMDADTIDYSNFNAVYDRLKCMECPSHYIIPRDINEERKYISRKLESKELKHLKILNLDDEAIPIAEDKVSSEDGKYFVKAILTDSRIGQRLVVYAGEKGKKEKSQIFIEPSIKRLAFDQKDIHPSEVFVKLEATFEDGTMSSITKATPSES